MKSFDSLKQSFSRLGIQASLSALSFSKTCRYLWIAACCATAIACNSQASQEELRQQISDCEQRLSMIDIASNSQLADSLVVMYIDYAKCYDEDSLAPIYLFKASDIVFNLGNTDKAIEILDQIINEYPSFEEIPLCYFSKGVIYESAERYDDAKIALEDYIKNFPDHYMVGSAQAMIPMLGLSPDEQLEYIFEQQSNASNLVQH